MPINPSFDQSALFTNLEPVDAKHRVVLLRGPGVVEFRQASRNNSPV